MTTLDVSTILLLENFPILHGVLALPVSMPETEQQA